MEVKVGSLFQIVNVLEHVSLSMSILVSSAKPF